MDTIVKKLAKKYNISEFKIELIIKSQFGLLKKAIEEGDFESVRVKHVGMFTVKVPSAVNSSVEVPGLPPPKTIEFI